MPLRFDVEEYLGTNSDGSRSDEFCYYCLKDGKYIVDISMWEMIDIWIKYTDKYNEYADTDYSPKELREILDKRLPTLNRWRQKQETSSLHHKMIQNIIVYINGHLTEVLNTDTLSSMSGLSKFHFRRVFRTATGENIGSYIQRLRMEHVAHLLISTDYTLKQIIEQTSYQTKYSIAKAFKKHFGISTSQYREKHRPNGENPATNIKPEIKVISPIKIFCIEVGEAYKNKLKYRLLWNKLLHHAEQYEADPRYDKFISLSMDDPSITPTEKCRFYLGITLRDDTKARPVPGIMQIPGGRYAVFRHTGIITIKTESMAKISEIMLLQQPEQPALAIEVQTYMKGMSQAIGENFVRIDSLFKKQGEVTTDIPFVEYPDFESLTEDRIKMIIGLKSSKPLQGDEKIQSVILPARRIVVCLHRGNYNELAQLYNEMTEWIKTNGYKASGTSIEYYYSNPDVPEEEHVTRVEMPLL